MRARGIDYFENSRRATLAQRAYAHREPRRLPRLRRAPVGPDGLRRPGRRHVRDRRPRARSSSTYAARGASLHRDRRRRHHLARRPPAARSPFAPGDRSCRRCWRCARTYGEHALRRVRLRRRAQPDASTRRCAVQHGRVVPGVGWFDVDYLGIDQGPILAMIENYRSGLVWRTLRRNPHIVRGLAAARASRGGWLDATGRRVMKPWRGWAPLRRCWPPRCASPAAAGRATGARPSASGRMGREGEVVQELVRDFEREQPGRARRRPADPVDARRTRSCSPRTSARSTPDVAQLGNTWIAEFAALRAIAPLDGARRRVARRRARRLLPRHLGHERHRRRALRRAVVRGHARALLPHATCCAARRLRLRCPATGTAGARAMAALQRVAGAGTLRHLPADERVDAAGSSSACRPARRCSTDDGTRGAFARPAFRRAVRLLPRASSATAWRPPVGDNEIANLYQEFARGTFAMYITGPVEPGRVPPPACPPRCRTRGPRRRCPGPTGRRPGVSPAGGSSLVVFRASRHPDAAWRLHRVPVAARRSRSRFFRLTGDLPARREAWRDTALAADPTRARLPPAARARGPDAQDPGVGADRDPAAGRAPRPRCAARATADAALARARPRRRPHAREAPLAGGRGSAGAGGGRRAVSGALEAPPEAAPRWAFLAPALVLIGVFFFAAGARRAAAVASPTSTSTPSADPRHGALRRAGATTRRLLRDPDFWKALRQHALLRRRRRAAVGGGLAGGGAAARTRSWRASRGLFRTIYFAPVVTTLVAVAIVWRYLYHPQYGLLNYALGAGRASAPIDWLGDPHWAMPAIILLAVWKNFGYNMLIFVAGLQSIPEELYEAARLDGAGGWAALPPRHAAEPGADLPVRRRDDDDRLLPALRRALRDDPGRAAAGPRRTRRAAHVRGGLPLVADGHGARRSRSCCS